MHIDDFTVCGIVCTVTDDYDFQTSLRATALISGVLGRAGERGQKRRLEAAQRGEVTWKTPADVQGYFELASARAADVRRRQAQDNSVEEQKEKDTFLSEDALKEMFGGGARV